MVSYKNIIFYNGFWYSTHSPIGQNEYSILFNQKENLQRIVYELRLLSLIFDTIYVPRSHFLTFQSNSHGEIVKQYLKNSDFNYFRENSILLSSTLPSLDEYSDTERVIERVKDNKWSTNLDDGIIEIIKQLPSTKIDSGQESQNKVDEFDQFINLITQKNKNLGTALSEIKKKSTYNYIPFFHETFIEELLKSDKISELDKTTIWRKTNSIYISSSGLDLGQDRRINFNGSIEDSFAKNDNQGILRELYSPEFIKTIFIDELGEKHLLRFLNGDISKVMAFRHLKVWENFRSEIFEMFKTISLLEKMKTNEFNTYSNERKLLEYKKFIIKEENTGIAGILADLLTIASDTIDPITGKIIGSGKKVIADKLTKTYTNIQLTKKMKNYRPFWKQLKESLEKVNF